MSNGAEKLFQAHVPWALRAAERFCKKYAEPDELEDIKQDALFRLWRSAQRYTEVSPFSMGFKQFALPRVYRTMFVHLKIRRRSSREIPAHTKREHDVLLDVFHAALARCKSLTKQERFALEKKFAPEAWTKSEIGKKFGVSREMGRLWVKSGLEKLAAFARREGLV
jgi:RNA polymerase sigma factor (sigma-70 family)